MIGVKGNKNNKQHVKSKLLSSFERMASFLCLLSLLYVRCETAENSCLFSSVSLTPIAEYGHQQSRVEDNPKILRRRPQNPHKRNAHPQSENPKIKTHPNKTEIRNEETQKRSLSSD